MGGALSEAANKSDEDWKLTIELPNTEIADDLDENNMSGEMEAFKGLSGVLKKE